MEGQDSEPCSGIYSRGLHCVTVLIGVFDKTTSLPIIGELRTVSAHTIIHIHCLYRHVHIYSSCLCVCSIYMKLGGLVLIDGFLIVTMWIVCMRICTHTVHASLSCHSSLNSWLMAAHNNV